MKIRKTLSATMLTLTMACGLVAAASCDLMHEHAFSNWKNVTEPTCTAFGLKMRSCDCGAVEYDTIAALAHTPVIDEAIGATCTTQGKTEGSHCDTCGTMITAQTETSKVAHSFMDWETVTEPTCTAFGLKMRSCDCGAVEYDTIAALAHTPVIDEAIGATCTTQGKTEGNHCDTCGTMITAQSTIEPMGHSCSDITVLQEALCNLDGTKRFACINPDCSYYYDENYALSALDSAEIYAEAVQYTGVIQCFDRFGNFMMEASAFVISADGKIVTGNLAIDNAFSLSFCLGGVYYDVTEVLAYSNEKNIAVLKIDASDLPYANICMQDVSNAERVYMMGAPSGYTSSLLSGVISNASLVVGTAKYIQHDILARTGCVGSPLINQFGEVIGINVGYVGDDLLGIAATAAELNALDYSTPMSVYEYGEATYTPTEQLNNWVANNYNGTANNSIAYVIQGSSFYYSLGYDLVSNYSFAEGYWLKENNYQLYVRIIFDNANGTYQYYATLTDGMRQNEVNGFLEAASYTASTILTYDTFYGKYWTEADLMALYSTSIYDTLGFFSYCLDTYFDTITLETFGFTISYDRDGDALTKLNSFVMNNGTLNEGTGAYEFTMTSMAGEDNVVLTLTHTPATEEIPGSTIATIYYYMASGALFQVSLALDVTESGNRFDLVYAVYDGTEFVVQNMAWGYLDAGSLTDASKLTCYVFDGMNEYEDGLLMDYASFRSHLMTWMNYIMPSVSPELSIKDLGFFFYFG